MTPDRDATGPGTITNAMPNTVAKIPPLSGSGGVENVTDKLYRTHASGVDAPGRHVWVGMSVYGVP